DGGGLAGPHQFRHRAVAAVRCGLAQDRLHFETPPPGLPARLVRAHEIGEVDGRDLGPDPAGAAEIRNAGFRADARAGEHHDAPRGFDHATEFFNLAVRPHGKIPRENSSYDVAG